MTRRRTEEYWFSDQALRELKNCLKDNLTPLLQAQLVVAMWSARGDEHLVSDALFATLKNVVRDMPRAIRALESIERLAPIFAADLWGREAHSFEERRKAADEFFEGLNALPLSDKPLALHDVRLVLKGLLEAARRTVHPAKRPGRPTAEARNASAIAVGSYLREAGVEITREPRGKLAKVLEIAWKDAGFRVPRNMPALLDQALKALETPDEALLDSLNEWAAPLLKAGREARVGPYRVTLAGKERD